MPAEPRPAAPQATATQPVGPERGGATVSPPPEPPRSTAETPAVLPGERPTTTRPGPHPAGPPALPPYLTVLERTRPDDPFEVQARPQPPGTLELTTRNVLRLRIDRRLVPLRRDRSIAVWIDGQGIEWTTRHDTLLLERTRSGTWRALPQGENRPGG